MGKNWNYAAGIIWPMLTERASHKKTITYGEIAPHVGTVPLGVGKALGPIQDYCLEMNIPPLTSIVIRQDVKIPGDGFIAWNVKNITNAHDLVFQYNWDKLDNPFSEIKEEDTIESLADALLKGKKSPQMIYRRIKVRGIMQQVFRTALLDAYEAECCFCGLSFEDALEAAHIVPFQEASDEQQFDIRNGLLLCCNHHKLFDDGYLMVNELYEIRYSDPKEKKYVPYSDIDSRMTSKIHGNKMRLPKTKSLWPDLNCLKGHRKKYRGKD